MTGERFLPRPPEGYTPVFAGGTDPNGVPWCPADEGPEQDFSLAADLDPNAVRLELIDRARENGASWAAIGVALGMSGPVAKRHAHRLRDRVKRASLLAAGEG